MQRSAGILAALLPAGVVYVALTGGSMGFSPDSVFYWSAAREFAFRGGIATGIAYGDVADRVGTPQRRSAEVGQSIPLTTWPPAYPLAIGVTMRSLGISATAAARAVNLVAVGLTLIAAGWLASRMMGRVAGALTASLLGVLAGVQDIMRMVWSESLFGLFVVLTLLCVTRWLDARGRRSGWLMLAAFAAAAATYTRYAGVSLYGFLLLVVGRSWTRRTTRRRSDWAAVLLYPVLILPLLARNIAITGHFSGAPREAGSNLLHAVLSAGLGLLGGVAPLARDVTPGAGDVLSTLGYSLALWLAGSMLIAGVLVWNRDRTTPAAEVVRTDGGTCAREILLAFGVVYLLFATAVVWLWRTESGTRLFYPSLVCIALLAFAGLVRRLPNLTRPAAGFAVVVTLASITFLSLSRVDGMRGGWSGYNSPRFLDAPVVRWVRTEVAKTPAPRVWTDPWLVPLIHFATAQPVARLPNLDQLPAALAAVRAPEVVAVLAERGDEATFECREYRAAYQRVLDDAASTVLGGPGFRAWRLRGDEGSRASLQKQVGAINVASLCSVAPGRGNPRSPF